MSNNSDKILTICVPSFSRPDKIKTTIETIAPQLDDSVTLNVLDDHSPTPIEPEISETLKKFSEKDINVIRHPHNIGCGPNIMRSFEICKTEWLWVPGDDDEIKPNAIEIIFDYIKKHPDVSFMNFSTNISSVTEDTITTGRMDFLQTMNFGNVLFMTSGIYKAPKFQDILQIGYQFQQTNAPHTAVLITALKDDDKVIFSKERICDWEVSPVETHGAFLREHGLQKVMIFLLDLSISHQEKKVLADKMLSHYIDIGSIFISHFHRYSESKDKGWFRYEMKTLIDKARFFDPNKKRKFICWIFKLLSTFPILIPFSRMLWSGLNKMLAK